MERVTLKVSIIIPVLNKLEFTRQCLDRIWRNTGDGDRVRSHHRRQRFIRRDDRLVRRLARRFRDRFATSATRSNLGFAKANNTGARHRARRVSPVPEQRHARAARLAFRDAACRRADPTVGIVGIKQLFPYTNVIYHTGVVFAPGGMPQHLYPHLDASLPHVNKEREYQAVNGACLLIARALFDECGGFDEAYVNGYEDTDLCMTVRSAAGRSSAARAHSSITTGRSPKAGRQTTTRMPRCSRGNGRTRSASTGTTIWSGTARDAPRAPRRPHRQRSPSARRLHLPRGRSRTGERATPG